MLGSYRVFQYISLPLKNARLTPAVRAASIFVRWSPDQYSSWPDETNAFGLFAPTRSLPRRSVSTPAQYLMSYPFASRNRTIGYSALNTKLRASLPLRVSNGRL